MLLRRFSLRARLVALVSTLLAGVSLFLLLYFPSRMDSMSRSAVEQRATGIATVLANAVAPGLEVEDGAAVTELLQGLSSAPEALYAAVLTSDGRTLATWNPERIGDVNRQPVTEPRAESRGARLEVAVPVKRRSGGRGTLLAGFSLQEVERERRANLLAAAAVALGIVIVGLSMAFVISTWLSRSISRLTDVSLLIASGDLSRAEELLGGRSEVARTAVAEQVAQGSDELKRLASSFALMLQSLQDASSTLHQSAGVLREATLKLTDSAAEQAMSVSQQAEALRETQTTAEQLSLSTHKAVQNAQGVLKVAERANAISESGENTIVESLGSLGEIRTQVELIAAKIGELSMKTQQIGEITETVKDLADQSHLLALNAGIEAARSGEHGRGFSVVAQEMRALSDQSIEGTVRVRRILNDILAAMREAVSITVEGTRKIEGGLSQVKASGENMKELSTIVRDNAVAVRQIAAAVNQQHAGFGQIFNAVLGLGMMMDQTQQRIESTSNEVGSLKDASERVAGLASRYRV